MQPTIQRASAFVWLLALASPAACALKGPVYDGAEDDGGYGGYDPTGPTVATSVTTTVGSTGSGEVPEPTCPYDGVPLKAESLGVPVCPTNLCGGGGHCLPEAIIAATFNDPSQIQQLAKCDAASRCVPDFFIENKGLFIPKSCDSVAGAEGRCLSECLPQVAEKKGFLPQSSCAANERCVPCFDPQTQLDTGACRLSCDPGPRKPPTTLPKCCKGIGTCVPASAVPEDKKKQLGVDACPKDQGMLCAPDVFVNDLNYKPEPCTTTALTLIFGEEYAAGVCLPECLPEVSKGIGGILLGKDGCPDHFKCAPCVKPGLFGPEETGACNL
jgi:hypothetical protein